VRIGAEAMSVPALDAGRAKLGVLRPVRAFPECMKSPLKAMVLPHQSRRLVSAVDGFDNR
jgi:hypothetical protein